MATKPKDRRRFLSACKVFDRVRYGFHALDRRPLLTTEELRSLVIAAAKGLQTAVHQADVASAAKETPFHMLWVSHLHERFAERYGDLLSVFHASVRLIDDLHWIERDLQQEEDTPAEESMADVLPPQSLAPITFEIVDDVLSVVHREPQSDPEDVANVLAARDALIQSGDNAYQELSNTNCDQRLLSCLADLNQKIGDGSSIIVLGLANISLSHMTRAYADELPDAVHALLAGHSSGIRMYISQFSDWLRFSEKAALAEMTEPERDTVIQATDDIIQALENRSDVAEPEIPRTLAFLRDLARDPTAEAKRVAYALLRTLENLCICVFQYGDEFIRLTMQKVQVDLSKGTARVAVGTLLGIAVYAAATLTPVAKTISDSQWLPKALEIAQKQLQEIAR